MIDVDAPSAVAEPVSESAPEASAAQAAGPAPETATAKADAAPDGQASVDTTPLVADFNPLASGGDDEATVEAFKTAPQPNSGSLGGAFPTPSSSVAKSAKDKAIAVATTPPPGPGQSTLVHIPRYSGPVPARPDASGQFPLAALVVQRAKEQLADVSLLQSSVEYALSQAAQEVAILKRELGAAKGLVCLLSRTFPP